MDKPLEVVFRDISKSDSVQALIDEKVGKLEQVCDYINSCRLVIERPQAHQKSGNPYRVRLDIRVPPGQELVVKQEAGEGNMHDSLETVLREIFSSARRKLVEVTERQRQEVKEHPEQEVGAVVANIDKEKGFGFLLSTDGRRIYFHKNAVTGNEFDRLELGTGVRYVESQGDDGPQASTVHIISKMGARDGKM